MIQYVLMGDRLIEEGHHQMENIRILSNADMDKISMAAYQIGAFNASYSLYEICKDNFQEIEDYYNHLATIPGLNQETGHQIVISFNRLLLNYLSSFRTFIDHQETRIKRFSDVNHDWLEEFKNRTSYHYNNFFSYRFLWNLRNYVQHCGFPSARFSFEDKNEENLGEIPSFSIYLDRDSLLNQFKGWKKVKVDIQNQPQDIEIITHIRQLQACLDDIGNLSIRIDIARMGEHYNYMVNLFNEVIKRYPDATPCLGKIEIISEAKANILGFSSLPINTVWKIGQVLSIIKDTQ